MIRLFYAPGTCALAPHIVLEWIGVDYELEKITFGDPEYLKINPQGKVPAMVDGDSGVMTQADAILKYLAAKYPEAGLGGDGTLLGAYEINRWLAFFTGDMHPAFYPFFRPGRYTTSSDEAALKTPKEAAYQLIDTVFTQFNQHMTDRTAVVGDRYSVVDPYAFSMLRWGNLLPKPLAEYPNLDRFYQQFKADAGVQRAMEQQGIK
ncbi:MAG: glutathione S-transferase N-terminal domain-containing protein [Elainellaceae cyanobacterium]